MRHLILVKHSLPQVQPGVTASRWRLSKQGRQRARRLAEILEGRNPSAVVASPEPKALETAEVIAGRLNTQVEIVDGLREHDRRDVPFSGAHAEFEEKMALFFNNPGRLVFGNETADEAHARFSMALFEVIERSRNGHLVAVTHGTVMTLFTARAAGGAPFPFWQRLDMPSFVVMELPSLRLREVVVDVVAAEDPLP